MYLRKCFRRKGPKTHVYWELVESYRTERGPRQRVVAYLGDMELRTRKGVAAAAEDRTGVWQRQLFDEDLEPDWVEVDTRRVRVERTRHFGGSWLAVQVMRKLGLMEFLHDKLPVGREDVPWSVMAAILVICRLCNPSSELYIAEHLFERTALSDLLGVSAAQVNDDRLYRALDALLPHKMELEVFLKERLGELFDLEYDLLLYDVTSTYFEGAAEGNPQAQRGYSRDHRPDCKQVCIALVVSRCGMPLGYEVFDGNRPDVTTVEEIVGQVEARYGKADRIWVMDRGMVSEKNLQFLRAGGRRYILGTPRSHLKRFEQQLSEGEWTAVREGLDVKLCPGPDTAETFILCRSAARRDKERAIHTRFETRIEEGLARIARACETGRRSSSVVERQVGRLMEANSRAAALFQVSVRARDGGGCELIWSKSEAWRSWANLSEGCYLLRSNVTDWSAEQLWHAYIQLTEAEAAFRIHKSDLSIRPIWHQKTERVQAHILVCFLAFVLWKTLAQLVKAAGLGDEPRKVLDELAQIQMVDVVMQTRTGTEVRRRCIAQPTKHQAILLNQLHMRLPRQLRIVEM